MRNPNLIDNYKLKLPLLKECFIKLANKCKVLEAFLTKGCGTRENKRRMMDCLKPIIRGLGGLVGGAQIGFNIDEDEYTKDVSAINKRANETCTMSFCADKVTAYPLTTDNEHFESDQEFYGKYHDINKKYSYFMDIIRNVKDISLSLAKDLDSISKEFISNEQFMTLSSQYLENNEEPLFTPISLLSAFTSNNNNMNVLHYADNSVESAAFKLQFGAKDILYSDNLKFMNDKYLSEVLRIFRENSKNSLVKIDSYPCVLKKYIKLFRFNFSLIDCSETSSIPNTTMRYKVESPEDYDPPEDDNVKGSKIFEGLISGGDSEPSSPYLLGGDSSNLRFMSEPSSPTLLGGGVSIKGDDKYILIYYLTNYYYLPQLQGYRDPAANIDDMKIVGIDADLLTSNKLKPLYDKDKLTISVNDVEKYKDIFLGDFSKYQNRLKKWYETFVVDGDNNNIKIPTPEILKALSKKINESYRGINKDTRNNSTFAAIYDNFYKKDEYARYKTFFGNVLEIIARSGVKLKDPADNCNPLPSHKDFANIFEKMSNDLTHYDENQKVNMTNAIKGIITDSTNTENKHKLLANYIYNKYKTKLYIRPDVREDSLGFKFEDPHTMVIDHPVSGNELKANMMDLNAVRGILASGPDGIGVTQLTNDGTATGSTNPDDVINYIAGLQKEEIVRYLDQIDYGNYCLFKNYLKHEIKVPIEIERNAEDTAYVKGLFGGVLSKDNTVLGGAWSKDDRGENARIIPNKSILYTDGSDISPVALKEIIESDNRNESIKIIIGDNISLSKLNKATGECNLGIFKGKLDDQKIINNLISLLIELNINPLNVHSLQKFIPFSNIYNYSYSFERFIYTMYNLKEVSTWNNVINHNPLSHHLHLCEETTLQNILNGDYKVLFLKMLVDPYFVITDNNYNENLQRQNAVIKAIFNILRGSRDTYLGMGIPKFLSDQVLSKSLLNSTYIRVSEDSTGFRESRPDYSVLGGATNRRDRIYGDDPDLIPVEDVEFSQEEFNNDNQLKMDVDPRYGIRYRNSTIPGEGFIGSVPIVQESYRRLDTQLMRNTIFISNVQRIMRYCLSLWLSKAYGAVAHGDNMALAAEVTERRYGNSMQTEYDERFKMPDWI